MQRRKAAKPEPLCGFAPLRELCWDGLFSARTLFADRREQVALAAHIQNIAWGGRVGFEFLA